MQDGKRPAVGFDFGTSTILVAAHDSIVPIGHELPWMPSLVGYDDTGSVVVGEETEDALIGQVVRSIKRAITDRRNFVRVDAPAGVRDMRADDLMVELLRRANRRVSRNWQDISANDVVRLGCPAMWDGRQRRRLLEVAQRAGLPVTLESLVDEPVAAGIAWLSDGHVGGTRPLRVVVFDMGGGTLDIAVLDVRGAHHQDVSVLAAVGLAEAGDTLDDAIAEDLEYALGAAGVDIDAMADPEQAREQLLDAAREAKIALTTATEHVVALPRRLFGTNEIWYSRDQLNAVFQPQLDHAEQYVAGALRAARLTELAPGSAFDIARTPIEVLVEGVDVVVLSGGMSQIPYVAQRLRWLFGPSTRIELATTPPMNAVALGLARTAGYVRVNMYRPAFDVFVEWNQGREHRFVYEAFTPLVESWQIAKGGTDLRYVRNGRELKLPAQGTGRMRVVSRSGERLNATIDGNSLDGFPVALAEEDFEFSIYPNGRIRLTDANGTHEGQVADWYTMQGYDPHARD